MKKQLCALLALAMVVCLCLPGFAAAAPDVHVQAQAEVNADALSGLTGLEIDRAAALSALAQSGAIDARYSGAGFALSWEAAGREIAYLLGDMDDEGGLTLASALLPSYALYAPAGTLQGGLTGGAAARGILDFIRHADDGLTYIEDAYSSLFSQAVFVEISNHTVAGWLSEMAKDPLLNLALSACMETDLTPARYAAQALSAPEETWGMLAKYKADAMQYPELRLVRIELDIPALPHLYLWVRVDEYGASVRFAAERQAVTDWDETLRVLSEGQSDTGFMVDAFTLVFDDEDEKNVYIEAALTLPDQRVVAEMDCYLSHTDDYAWKVSCLVREDGLGEVAALDISADYGDAAALPGIPDASALSRLELPLTGEAFDNLMSDIRDIGLPALLSALRDAVPEAAPLIQ